MRRFRTKLSKLADGGGRRALRPLAPRRFGRAIAIAVLATRSNPSEGGGPGAAGRHQARGRRADARAGRFRPRRRPGGGAGRDARGRARADCPLFRRAPATRSTPRLASPRGRVATRSGRFRRRHPRVRAQAHDEGARRHHIARSVCRGEVPHGRLLPIGLSRVVRRVPFYTSTARPASLTRSLIAHRFTTAVRQIDDSTSLSLTWSSTHTAPADDAS